MNSGYFIYARAGNTGKLLSSLCYHPVLAYGISVFSKLGLNENFFVFTDTQEITEVSLQYNAEVRSLENQGSEIAKRDDQIIVSVNLMYPLLRLSTIKAALRQAESTGTNLASSAFSILVPGASVRKPFPLNTYENIAIENEMDRAVAEALIRKGFLDSHPIRPVPSFKIEHGPINGNRKMLFSAPYHFFPGRLRDAFEAKFDITYAFNAPAKEVVKLLPQAEIWLTGTCPPYKIDQSILMAGEQLSLIATPSTGTNHIDVSYVTERKIKLLSIKESPVIERIYASSEFTFSLLLAMVNKIPMSTEAARGGVWREQEHLFRSIELHGKVLGLIGYGRIGRKMARFANSFGMTILVFDPYVSVEEDYVKQVESKVELLRESDIVSLHYHLDENTALSFTSEDFNLMKNGSYFLNTARGELVDERAMLEVLRKGKLKAAAVDVISNEHLVDKWNHPVIRYARENENLLVSPHIAGCTVDSEAKAAEDVLRQILDYAVE